MSKKGDFNSVIFATVFIFTLVITIVLCGKVLTEFNAKIQAKADVPAVVKTTTAVFAARYPVWMDGAVITIWLFLMLLAMMLAMNIPSSPVAFPVSILAFMFITFLSYMFKIVYNRFVLDPMLSAEGAKYTVIPWLMTHLHYLSFIMGVIIIAIMVAKR